MEGITREAQNQIPLSPRIPLSPSLPGLRPGEVVGSSRPLRILGVLCAKIFHFSIKLRPISWRWIWLVPSQIWVIFASRIRRSTR